VSMIGRFEPTPAGVVHVNRNVACMQYTAKACRMPGHTLEEISTLTSASSTVRPLSTIRVTLRAWSPPMVISAAPRRWLPPGQGRTDRRQSFAYYGTHQAARSVRSEAPDRVAFSGSHT